MTLGLYERASPETTNVNEMQTWKAPESLAWFARTIWLSIVGGQDWSTGECRDPMDVFLDGPDGDNVPEWMESKFWVENGTVSGGDML